MKKNNIGNNGLYSKRLSSKDDKFIITTRCVRPIIKLSTTAVTSSTSTASTKKSFQYCTMEAVVGEGLVYGWWKGWSMDGGMVGGPME